MTHSLPSQQRRERIQHLALELIDPAGALAALAIVLPLTTRALLAFEHGASGVEPQAVLRAWAAVLLFSNTVTLIRLLCLGIDPSLKLIRGLTSSPVGFSIGFVLMIAAHASVANAWFKTLPSPDLIMASAVCLAAIYALLTGLRRGLPRALELLRLGASTLRVAATNRSHVLALAGDVFLCGGEAHGAFRDRNLIVGAPHRGEVLLYGKHSANRGTLVTGGSGTSKTRSKIYPDFYMGLRTSPWAGALVFANKKRMTNDCLAIARSFRPPNKIHVVGTGSDREHINISSGMTHESIGDAIRDGLGTSHSDFWVHGPAAFTEGFIELSKALAPATVVVPPGVREDSTVTAGGESYELEIADAIPTYLSLMSLNQGRLDAVFSHGFQHAADLAIRDEPKARKLRDLINELKDRVAPLMLHDARLAEEFRQSVLPQLQPFARGELKEGFCDPFGINLSLLEKGHVIIVEIDETATPRAVGTVVRMIFRRVTQMARERTASHRIGTLNPILLVCDEYTNYAASGHIPVWNTIRESNFISTIGITSMSALVKQLGGDTNAAAAIMANFGNKFYFETDDKTTRDFARELISKSLVKRRGRTDGKSHSRGGTGSTTTSQSQSETEQLEEIITGDVWRGLGAGRDYATAIAFTRTPEGVKTDVVTLGVLDPSARIYTALPEGYGLSGVRTMR